MSSEQLLNQKQYSGMKEFLRSSVLTNHCEELPEKKMNLTTVRSVKDFE
jgi:hypothetical protein